MSFFYLLCIFRVTFSFVRFRVGEASSLTSFAAVEAIEIGTNFMFATRLYLITYNSTELQSELFIFILHHVTYPPWMLATTARNAWLFKVLFIQLQLKYLLV